MRRGGKTLHIHIGHYKTGTTALQAALTQNATSLMKLGLDYPRPFLKNAKHSVFAFSLYKAVGVETLMHGYSNPETPESLWEQLFEYTHSSSAPDVLISSEEFIRLGLFPEAEQRLHRIVDLEGGGLDFRIIVYLRPPGAHLTSWFNQLVKMGQAVSDFDTVVTKEVERIHYDYGLAVAPWCRIFGSNRIEVHPYVRDAADPSALFRHFLGLFGVHDFDQLQVGGQEHNPSLDKRIVDLVRFLNDTGLPRSAVQSLTQQLMGTIDQMDAQTTSDATDFAILHQRIEEGLQALSALGKLHLEPEALAIDQPQARHRPMPDATEIMLHTLAKELLKLRRRINALNLEDLERRLSAIEKKLD